MVKVSIKQALEFVARHPEPASDVMLDSPVHELVARNLFFMANNPNPKIRGAMTKANRAQRMILDRMVGTRRAGTHPATRNDAGLEFVDLTAKELGGV